MPQGSPLFSHIEILTDPRYVVGCAHGFRSAVDGHRRNHLDLAERESLCLHHVERAHASQAP